MENAERQGVEGERGTVKIPLQPRVNCHAGSLTGNVIVCYEQGENAKNVFAVVIKDKGRLWELYCNDLIISEHNGSDAIITEKGKSEKYPCFYIDPNNVIKESSKIARMYSDS